MTTEITQLASLQYNIGDIVRAAISASFINDYGIVTAVNSDKTVNVTHAVRGEYINGEKASLTTTNNVEVLFPASASFGESWPIAIGDGVLLIGLKDKVPNTSGIQAPTEATSPPKYFPHYKQDTIKAIPLQTVSSPKVSVKVTDSGNLEIVNSNSGGLIKVANAAKSLYTVLDTLESHLSDLSTALLTFTTGLNVGTLTAQATAMATAATTAISNIATDRANLSALLEA